MLPESYWIILPESYMKSDKFTTLSIIKPYCTVTENELFTMPELAEVETIKSGITPVIKNSVVEKIDVCTKSIRYPLNINNLLALEGKTVTSILRRGKYLLWLFK